MEMGSGDVKDFLLDTNRFLSDTLQNEHLSTKAKADRDQLLQRLSFLLEPAGPYIDMSGPVKSAQTGEYVSLSTTREKNVESKLYEEFPDFQIPENSLSQDGRPNISIEHIILPAAKIRVVAQKFGPLWKKERFMGFFGERSIRCYVGLVGHHLYIYNSDKDTKPTTYINIEGFEARPAVAYFPRDSKRRDIGFEIVCPGKKSYQFLANTTQEMEQWINYINEAGIHVSEDNECEDIPRKLPPKPKHLPSPLPPSLNGEEEYDDVQGHNNCDVTRKSEEFGDDIYYNIKDISVIQDKSFTPSLQENRNSSHTSDNDLVYDDICSLNPSLYYNVNDQKSERPFESDKCFKECNEYGYDDEAIYDDIGVLLNTADMKNQSGVELSSNRLHATLKQDSGVCNVKKHNVSVDVTDSLVENCLNCVTDNVYEPVENPRD